METVTKRKDPAAVSLGKRGGAANTAAQTEARRKVMAQINQRKQNLCFECKVTPIPKNETFCEPCTRIRRERHDAAIRHHVAAKGRPRKQSKESK